jgi:2-polyprenyl-3-methyl-5-hydroxy-6-metoxy-1,4-benzoquinol methylase
VSPTSDRLADRVAAVGYDYGSREQEALRACNLCGEAASAEAARRDRYGYPAVLRICVRCGLGFLSPRLTAGEYAHFYRAVYRPLVSAYHGRRIDAETIQAEQLGYAAELVAFLRRELPRPPATVLDVGGSTGVVGGTVAEAFGSRATVLDPSPDELAVAAGRGMETIAGFAEDLDAAGRRWDLVLLCQTIDHLLDVSATLATLRTAVAQDGRAFVDVLDVALAMRRLGRVEEAVKIDHPFYLTAPTARAYFARAGLAVAAERLSGDGHWGFLLAPVEPREPDWGSLSRHAAALIDEIRRLTATRPAA